MTITQLKNQVSWFSRLCPGCRSQGSVQYRGEASRNSTSGRLRRRTTASRRSATRSPMLEPTERKTFAIGALVPASATTDTPADKLDPGDALEAFLGLALLSPADAHLRARNLPEGNAR